MKRKIDKSSTYYMEVILPVLNDDLMRGEISQEDLNEGYVDEFDVLYSNDGKRLIKCFNKDITRYAIQPGTEIIGDSAFEVAKNLKNITIPDTVTTLEDGAFYECVALESILLPDSVTSIGIEAIKLGLNLKKAYLPDSVVTIGEEAFSNCEDLQEIHLPKYLTSIGKDFLAWCKSLKDLELPETLTSIGNNAFYLCSSLRSLTIPSGVSSIGENPFVRCDKLDLKLQDNAKYKLIDGFLIDDEGLLISYVGHSENVQVPSFVTKIGVRAFAGNNSMKSCVILSESITEIPKEAFYRCEALSSVTLPATISTIEEDAFRGCRALRTVQLPDKISIIKSRAFWECRNLRDINIPDSMDYLSHDAFFYYYASDCPYLDVSKFPFSPRPAAYFSSSKADVE